MNITVIGSGYVGLVSGEGGFADLQYVLAAARNIAKHMSEATSIVVMEGLWPEGATVCAHEPAAMKKTRHIYGKRPDLRYTENPLDALNGADALIIVTEWKAFESPDSAEVKARLKRPVSFDGRNLFEPSSVAEQASNITASGGKVKYVFS